MIPVHNTYIVPPYTDLHTFTLLYTSAAIYLCCYILLHNTTTVTNFIHVCLATGVESHSEQVVIISWPIFTQEAIHSAAAYANEMPKEAAEGHETLQSFQPSEIEGKIFFEGKQIFFFYNQTPELVYHCEG